LTASENKALHFLRHHYFAADPNQEKCPCWLTVCVTGAGAGVDSAWEQEKLEARKMPDCEACRTREAQSHTFLAGLGAKSHRFIVTLRGV